MLMKALISVIIPIYKVERYLNECVSSVVNQTYKNLEIILVDDGSPDGCPQMCDEWAKRDSRIRVIHKENGGLSDARNAGMDIATGEYVAFVDSDDYIAPTMYETLVRGFSFSESVGIVSCQICSLKDGQIKQFNTKWNVERPKFLTSKEFIISKLTEETSFTVWNKLYTRTLLRNTRFRKGRNNEDTLFMYDVGRVMEQYQIKEVILSPSFYYYRIRSNSICTSTERPLMGDVIDNLHYIIKDCSKDRSDIVDAIYPLYTNKLFYFFNQLYVHESWSKTYFRRYKQYISEISILLLVSDKKMS